MFSRRSFGLLAGTSFLHHTASGAHRVGTLPEISSRSHDFSVMLWTLKDRGSFEQGLEWVAQAGYRHIELVDEYKRWSELDWSRTLKKLESLRISVDAIAGISAGFADPLGKESFLAELKQTLPTARRLGCGQVILLSGKRSDGATPEQQRLAALRALESAAPLLRDAGLTGVIEPIDKLEDPGIYLDGVSEAFEITAAVGSPHVKVLYDLYHEQRGRGDLIEKLERHLEQVGLIHVADVPGRHEPSTGEINFCNIFKSLARLRYGGVIAMEFYPTGDVVQTLSRAREEALRCLG